MSSDIARMRDLVAAQRARAVASLVHATTKEEVRYLHTQIDESKTSYEKGVDKDYVFEDTEEFSSEFASLVDCEILDYGVDDTTGTLRRDVYGRGRGREMSLDIEWSAPSTRVALRGAFFGEAGSFENLGDGLKAKFKLVGVPAHHVPALYEDLILEGFCMEAINRRLALFCYFSATECVLIDLIGAVKNTVPQELHNQLERLSIPDKIRIVGRASVPGGDLTKIELWSLMLESVKKTADIRNKIAHPRTPYNVTESDLDQAFLAFLLFHSILVHKRLKASEVIRMYFKKEGGRAQRAAYEKIED